MFETIVYSEFLSKNLKYYCFSCLTVDIWASLIRLRLFSIFFVEILNLPLRSPSHSKKANFLQKYRN